MRKLSMTFLVIILVLLLCVNVDYAKGSKKNVIIVPKDQPTIQSAVDSASDGDIIRILPGTYSENVVINKSVTIHGVKGAEETHVTSASGSTVFAIIASDVAIMGLTIDGALNGNVAGILIGALFPGDDPARGVSDVTVSECIIEGNNYGIYLWHASNCMIVNNTARNAMNDATLSRGIGIIIWDGNTDVTILTMPSQGNSIINNEIYRNDRDGIFVGCWPETLDGSVTSDNSNTKIHGNHLYENGYYLAFPTVENWRAIAFSYTSGSKKVSGNRILQLDASLYYGYPREILEFDGVTGLKAVGNHVYTDK